MKLSAEREAPDAGATLSFRGSVTEAWIDVNRHMNVSAYDVVFDAAEKAFFEMFGIGDAYIRRTDMSCFRLEKFIRYERELVLGDPLEVRSRVAWTDFRRIHHFHELWNVGAGYRAACADSLSIHVDLRLRKAAAMEMPEVREPLAALAQAHAALPPPAGLVPRMGGRRTGT
jgi:acyl-CoA thioester hydrolase